MIEQAPTMGGVTSPPPPAGPISWGLDALSWLLMRLHDLFAAVGVPPGRGGVWVVTILVFPVILRALLLPLFIKQVHGAARLAVIQKELAQIRDQAGDDRERMHREMAAVYEREKVSPFASCLPFVIQLPVYSGVFWVLHGAATKTPRGAAMTFHDAWNLAYTPFFGEYLSAHGWESILRGSTSDALHAVTLAVVVALLTWVSMTFRVRPPGTPKPESTRARLILRVALPVLVFVFALIMPVAVVLFGAATRVVVWIQRAALMLILKRKARHSTPAEDPQPAQALTGPPPEPSTPIQGEPAPRQART